MIGIPGVYPKPATHLPPYRAFSQPLLMPLPAIRILAIDSLRFIYGARGFLRDNLPTEASGAQKFTQEFGRRACRRYARVRGTLSGVSYSPIWSTVCDPYLDSIDEGPTTGGSYEPPFSGGQCSGTIYQVIVTYNLGTDVPGNCQAPFDQAVNGIFGVAGPVGGITTTSATIPGANLPGKASFLNHGNNQQISLGISFGGCNLPPVVIKSITRLSGNPDTCGDPPPEYRPPSFHPNLPTLPTPTNPAPGFGNNWDIDILPDGQVTFCIASDCSEGVPPDGGGGPDSGGGPGEPDGDPEETDPNDPSNPNEVSGCVKEGNLLTGLKIEVLEAPPNYQGLGDIYYRSCWIWMGPSSDLLDMVSDGRAIENEQFVIPDSTDCTCYRVRANPGFRISVQAYSRPKEE